MPCGGWTDKKLRKWASNVTVNAAELTLFVAQHAPEIDFDAGAQHRAYFMELPRPADKKVLGGTMSSGRHALNKIVGVRTQSVERDWSRGVCVIDERLAEVLADALS